MNRHLLVVCTANVCRSPVAAALLQRALDTGRRPDDEPWVVRSAGTSPVRAPLDRHTVDAASAVGLSLAGHSARHLSRDIVRADGTDLVVTMTRAHLREVVARDPSSWSRAFTLKELVRRAATMPPAAQGESVEGWLARVGEGRRASAMIKPDPSDDIDDPYGAPRRAHDELVRELTDLVWSLVRVGPWH